MEILVKKLVLHTEVHEKEPDAFNPQIQVAACFLDNCIPAHFFLEKMENGKQGSSYK